MLLREIFNDSDESQIVSEGAGLSIFLQTKPQRFSLNKSLWLSFLVHILVFLFVFIFAKILVYILMFLGIDLSLFQRPSMKIRDIEFVFVLPEKYDISKSFVKNTNGKNYSLAGPAPNNKPYNTDEGSLKTIQESTNFKKSKILNENPLKNTNMAASQTNKAASKKTKKGNLIPKIETPDIFVANMPETEMNTDFGFGSQGKSGIHSPNSGNATFKSSGDGMGGSGKGDSVGMGNTKGGGYYYGSAGAPRPQSANQYSNHVVDVDLRPYVTELQRRVLRNWSTPSNDNSKKTVLFLRIAKSGNLMILNIKTPSGDTYIDSMAINAVKKAQPFSPLPSGYRNAYADIILTFDYNVSAKPN